MDSDKVAGYLVGLFIGDGYSNYNKKNRHYNVEFYLNSVKDSDIIKFLCTLLTKMGHNYRLHKDKRYNCIRVRVSSKSLFKFMQVEIDKFYQLGIKNEEFDLGLLSGFIDAEGYVGNGEIVLTQKEYKTLEQIKRVCEANKIQTRRFWSSDNYKSTSKIWRLRIATSFREHSHISRKIARDGFEPTTSGFLKLHSYMGPTSTPDLESTNTSC